MDNLRKQYPGMFRKKETIHNIRPPHKVVWHDNVPIVTEYKTHKEIRKYPDSSPLILSKDYVL